MYKSCVGNLTDFPAVKLVRSYRHWITWSIEGLLKWLIHLLQQLSFCFICYPVAVWWLQVTLC